MFEELNLGIELRVVRYQDQMIDCVQSKSDGIECLSGRNVDAKLHSLDCELSPAGFREFLEFAESRECAARTLQLSRLPRLSRLSRLPKLSRLSKLSKLSKLSRRGGLGKTAGH